jgi:hypothetical protein
MLVPHIITISTDPARLSWLPGQTKSWRGDIQFDTLNVLTRGRSYINLG